MSRSTRLLSLIQVLRRRRGPVSARDLAHELGVSQRTVYRDIAALVAGGAPVEGAAGVGYVLRPGYLLPPLMFDDQELDALMLGLRLVRGRGDPSLTQGAADALAKIVAVLPPERQAAAAASGLFAGGAGPRTPHLAAIRRAMRGERKLRLAYADADGAATERMVWPVAIGFFDDAEVLASWCESRRAFRHFRLDRITGVEVSAERYPTRRPVLLAEWRRADRRVPGEPC